MKILHVIDSEGYYGAETVICNLAAEQNRQGHKATILNMRPCDSGELSLAFEAGRQRIDFVVIPLKAGFDFLGILAIVDFAKKNGYDIMHSHGYKPNILLGFLPEKIRALPVVSTLHGWTSTRRFSKMWFFEQLDLASLKRMDAVVVVTRAMQNLPRLKRKRLDIKIVNNGIPKICFDGSSLDKNLTQFCQNGFIIGAIGRLSKEKGFEYLIEATAGLVRLGLDAKLLIIGEGEERAFLENTIKKYGITERVVLPGYRDNARNYIPFFSVFVISSLTEGLPITLLEALQAKVPVVATRVGGIPEVLQDGETGILVPPADINSLVESIKRIATDLQLKNKIVEKATLDIVKKYSSEIMAQNYFAVYQQVLGCG